MILPIHLVCVSTLGVETALVLDIGYEEATLIPVFEGVPILKAWQALPIAAKAVHGYFFHYLKINNKCGYKHIQKLMLFNLQSYKRIFEQYSS